MKIAVYAICLDEAKFVEGFCASAVGADLILIADAGSNDETPNMARTCGAVVYSICVSPWRFDTARNTALALLPDDVDVCIPLDLDEKLTPGWREEIESVWNPGKTTRLRHGFDWGSGISLQYDRVHARSGYRWRYPVHECLEADRISEVIGCTPKTLMAHAQDPEKKRTQYLGLLELAVKENPDDPRSAFFLARELWHSGRCHEAIAACKRYLALPSALLRDQRSYAMQIIARCHSELGDIYDAQAWDVRAALESEPISKRWYAAAVVADRAAMERRGAPC